MLAVIETHPIQYHAPVYREVVRQGVPVLAVYGSDFSVAGYHDEEFNAAFKWDTDLLSGYESEFLSTVAAGGAATDRAVSARGIGRVLKSRRPDAVLVVGYSPRFHRHAWFEAWRSGAPVIFRGETSDAARSRSGAKDRIRHAALSLAYRTCARCLYIGHHSKAHLLRHGVPEHRLGYSPYCIDASPFETTEDDRLALRDATRQSMRIEPDQTAVLFSGKLSHRKGVDLLLEALAGLPDPDRRRVVLVCLGDGELRQQVDAAAAGAPALNVRAVGFRNQRELSPYYHAADLLALPSRHSETWGLVVNEALMHGVPAVVSDRVGCAPDLIETGRTGHVCEAGSAESLRSAILLTAPLGRTVAGRSACRQRVAEYSVERAASGIIDAYSGALASAGRAA